MLFTSVGRKDTLRNVKSTGEFVVNLATEPLLELGDSTLVLGDVTALTVRDDALVDGHPAMEHLRPLSRLGRNEWGLPPEVIVVDRPARPEDIQGLA